MYLSCLTLILIAYRRSVVFNDNYIKTLDYIKNISQSVLGVDYMFSFSILSTSCEHPKCYFSYTANNLKLKLILLNGTLMIFSAHRNAVFHFCNDYTY